MTACVDSFFILTWLVFFSFFFLFFLLSSYFHRFSILKVGAFFTSLLFYETALWNFFPFFAAFLPQFKEIVLDIVLEVCGKIIILASTLLKPVSLLRNRLT